MIVNLDSSSDSIVSGTGVVKMLSIFNSFTLTSAFQGHRGYRMLWNPALFMESWLHSVSSGPALNRFEWPGDEERVHGHGEEPRLGQDFRPRRGEKRLEQR